MEMIDVARWVGEQAHFFFLFSCLVNRRWVESDCPGVSFWIAHFPVNNIFSWQAIVLRRFEVVHWTHHIYYLSISSTRST